MTKLEVEFPVKINGVIINENIFNALDNLQRDCLPEFNNTGTLDKIADINKLQQYFIEELANKSPEEKNSTELELLTKLFWIQKFFEKFVLSEKFLTQKKPSHE